MTPQQLDAQFAAAVRKHYRTDRRLVHLGIPLHDRVVVWVAPGREDGAVRWSDTRAEGVDGAPSVQTSEAGTVRIELTGLRPHTRYVIRVPGAAAPLEAWTAPDPKQPAEARFLTFSCFSPFGHDVNGEVNEATVHALHLLRERARYADFAIASGDQVYVDEGGYKDPPPPRTLVTGKHAGKRMYTPGAAAACFDVLYRVFFSIPPLDEALARVPTAMMWDDHDIRDGWGSQGDEADAQWHEHFAAARSRAMGWQMLRNPQAPKQPELCCRFEWGSTTTVFVMDQRSARNSNERRVVSQEQLDAIRAWLGSASGDAPKCFVLVSPLPLTIEPNAVFKIIEDHLAIREDDIRDTWSSRENREQLDALLTLLVEHFDAHRKHRLVVLSGDMHYHDVRELESKGRGVFGHEIVSSGLAQPMFAPAGGDHTFLGDRLAARRLTHHRGPGFAELVVGLDGDVGLMLHVAARGHGFTKEPSELRNRTSSSWARTLGRTQALRLERSDEWGDNAFLEPASRKTGLNAAPDWSDPFD